MRRSGRGLAVGVASCLLAAVVAEGQLRAQAIGAAEPARQELARVGRRLYNTAIDACPQYWTDYFDIATLDLICPCETVVEVNSISGPATTYDLVKKQKACPTTTIKSKVTTPGPTTTTLLVTTTTVTITTTSTTPYCEACIPVTAGPTTGTSTTTLTSITETTTTTVTRTTTTSTVGSTGSITFTSTSTSTATSTITSTATTTSTLGSSTRPPIVYTTTTTATTTTITTTIQLPCSICPLYHFLCPDGCTNCVAPGMCRTVYHKQDGLFDIACDHRKSIQPPDPCVEFTSVQMSCPAGNLFPGRKVLLDDGVYPRLKCRTCGIHPLPADRSSFRGWWAGKVSWGPNQFESTISETEIHSYRLYIVDAMYQKLTEPLAVEEVRLWATLDVGCCDTEFYGANLDVELPVNYTYFMVVPVTINGLELNVGPVSERIKDLGGMLYATGGSRRLAALSWPFIVLGLVVTIAFR